jgi:hypothetical protein
MTATELATRLTGKDQQFRIMKRLGQMQWRVEEWREYGWFRRWATGDPGKWVKVGSARGSWQAAREELAVIKHNIGLHLAQNTEVWQQVNEEGD